MQYPARAALACVLGEGKPPSLISALCWVSHARRQPCWRPSLRPLLPFPSLPPQRRTSSSLRWFRGCCCPAAHCCWTPSLGTCFWCAPQPRGGSAPRCAGDAGHLPQPELSWAAHQPRASRVFHINRLPNSCAGVGASRSRVLAPVAIFAFSFPPRAHPRSVSGALGGWQQPQERFRGQGLAAAVLPGPAWGHEVSRQCAHLSPRTTSGAADGHPERVAGTSEGGSVW